MAAISRKLVVPALAAGVLVVAGASYGVVAKYRNIPGPVTGSLAAGIKGTFHLQASPTGLLSKGYGGACLIFRAKDLNRAPGVDLDWMEKKHCTTDDDCTRTDITPNIHGYCHLPSHQCWTKPVVPSQDKTDPLVCLRRREGPANAPPTPPLVPGQVMTISVSAADLAKMKIPPNSKVRVLTCLNGIPGGGCAVKGNPAQHEFGTPKQL